MSPHNSKPQPSQITERPPAPTGRRPLPKLPGLPREHLRTLDWMFRYSNEYLKKHARGSFAERAMALADVSSFQDWLKENWPH